MSKLEGLAKKLEELHKGVQLQQPLGETAEKLSEYKDAFAEVRMYVLLTTLVYLLSTVKHSSCLGS